MNKDAKIHSHHISQQFNADLEEVKNNLLEMGGMVEKQLSDAIDAIITADSGLGALVREDDAAINAMEMQIDEECKRILARRQPAASDLRLVLSIIKAVNDLERIGDESAKIARLAIELTEQGESSKGYVEIRHIGEHVRRMVSMALDAFARYDIDAALAVAREDVSVDLEYSSAMREMITYMIEDPRSITRVLNVVWALRALERVGDHAKNIAEQIIFIVKGEDVRHSPLAKVESVVG